MIPDGPHSTAQPLECEAGEILRLLGSGTATVTMVRAVATAGIDYPIRSVLQREDGRWVVLDVSGVMVTQSKPRSTTIDPHPFHGIGATLWCAERWCVADGIGPVDRAGPRPPHWRDRSMGPWYEADGPAAPTEGVCTQRGAPRPADSMPPWASRVSVTVVELQVMRLAELRRSQVRQAPATLREIAAGRGDRSTPNPWVWVARLRPTRSGTFSA